MKSIIAVILVFVALSLSACGINNDFTDNETLNKALTSMSDDFKITSENFYSQAESIVKNTGKTYDGYIECESDVCALYDDILTVSEDIYLRTQNNSIEYFEMVASFVALDDECWEDYMRAFSNVWESSISDYYDLCFDSLDYIHTECTEILKSEFYSDNIDADTYFKEIEKLNDLFSETDTKIHDLHLEAYKRTSDDFFAVYSGFSAGNTDVSVNLSRNELNEEIATSDEIE